MGHEVRSSVLFLYYLHIFSRITDQEDRVLLPRMLEGMISWTMEHNGQTRMQVGSRYLGTFMSNVTSKVCTSTLWDTALNSVLLRQLGMDHSSETLKKSVEYLMARQCSVCVSYFVLVTKFSFENSRQLRPTCRVLLGDSWMLTSTTPMLTIPSPFSRPSEVRERCLLGLPQIGHNDGLFKRGLSWILQMQNADGGYAAFDVNCDSKVGVIYKTNGTVNQRSMTVQLVESIPFNDVIRSMTDPSVPDMTARASRFLLHEMFAAGIYC